MRLIEQKILRVIAESGRPSGAQIYLGLQARGWAVRAGAIYPALTALERLQMISGDWGLQVSGRPRRRHYAISLVGEAFIQNNPYPKTTLYDRLWCRVAWALGVAKPLKRAKR